MGNMKKLSKYNYLYKNSNKLYLYNMITRAFLQLDPEVCKKLFTDINLIDEDIRDILYKYGIICDADCDEIEKMTELYQFVTQNDTNATIFLSMTQNCNMSCSYCYEDCRDRGNDGEYISEDNIFSIIKFIKKKKFERLTVVYFWGRAIYIY